MEQRKEINGSILDAASGGMGFPLAEIRRSTALRLKEGEGEPELLEMTPPSSGPISNVQSPAKGPPFDESRAVLYRRQKGEDATRRGGGWPG